MTDPQDGAPELPGPTLEAAAAAPPSLGDSPAEVQDSREAPAEAAALEVAPKAAVVEAPPERPTFRFFGVLAAVSLIADVSSKAWAEITLLHRSPADGSIQLIKDHLSFTLAYNPGGAWGLFQHHSEFVRRPFFLLVSLLAIAFIINLYGRLNAGQKALKWGLPLVLGGALGNLSDRIVRSNVIDFIDYQADWIAAMNRLIAKVVSGWSVTEHWPTFNVADIAICVGVGLMAVDMFTSRRGMSASMPPRPPSDGNLPLSPAAAPEPGRLELSEAAPPLKPDA
jgi:signal peptidase II